MSTCWTVYAFKTGVWLMTMLSSLFVRWWVRLQTPRGGGTPILGQYGYVPWESRPPPPLFLALAAPKDSTFPTCAARKDPPFQNLRTIGPVLLT